MRKGTKKGFTLVELMAVVSIIGILSAMGVSSLQQAVVNTRTRDAAVNVAAFMERVAQEAKQKNTPLCVTVDGSDMFAIKYIESTNTCSGDVPSDTIDRMKVEDALIFNTASSTIDGVSCNLANRNAVFIPRIGLTSFRGDLTNSNCVEKGLYVLCYASADGNTCAGIVKTETNNRFSSYMSYDKRATWSKL